MPKESSPVIDEVKRSLSQEHPEDPSSLSKKAEEQEKLYFDGLKTRLEQAKQQRDRIYVEFGNKTYLQRYEENRRKANTALPPKKNEEDVIVSSGTLEQKLEAVLAGVNNLDLNPTVRAYDYNNNRVQAAGTALEDIIFQTGELDNDDEKKLLRQKELLIQGEVFVEERWLDLYKVKKKLKKEFNGQYDVEWSQESYKCFSGPSRRVKYGPNIYLGDITQFDMNDQPFIFEVEVKGFEETKSIFGKWDRWEEVERRRRARTDHAGTEADTVDKRWIIDEINDKQCEVIVYQDRWNNEFQVIINGVMMLKPGFPLSVISPGGEYTIQKQIFKITDAHFAYGRGFIQSSEPLATLLDEMLKLAVLKTRKSFMPAWTNTSKRLISARVLQPGKITMGIDPATLQPLGDTSEGVTPSEFQMIRELQDKIDELTVSPQFTGQQGKSGTTATEVLELQRQAKMTLELVVTVCAMLERKCGYARLWNILEHWMEPIDKVVVGDGYVNKFRKTSRETDIPNEGRGEREVILTDGDIPADKEIRKLEVQASDKRGYPVQKIIINPETMRNAVKTWYVVVTPKEKRTSDLEKILFREKLVDMASVAQFGARPSAEFLEEDFARVWGADRSKAFEKAPAMPAPAEGATGGVDPNAAASGNVAGLPTRNNVKLAL